MQKTFGRGIGLGLAVAAMVVLGGGASRASAATSPCNLGPGGNIHHVVYVQFDNTHLSRDNANVPSDLEQIPALKSFLTSSGTLDSNEHTILISHTAGGIISSLTGLYPDRNGINVSNNYGVFKPNGSIDVPNATAFTYWTDASTINDPLPNLITNGQKNTPAPWVPYTNAGCDVGAFSIADMEIENLRTTGNAGDISKVFGTSSSEVTFANGSAPTAQKVADFEGIAVHCSQADSATGHLCQPSVSGDQNQQYGGRPDSLPDEPGGYTGFNGLFGGSYVNQVVSNPGSFVSSTRDAYGTAANFNDVAPPVNDVFDFSHTKTPATCTVDGGPCPAPTPLQNSGNNGFPNTFNPSAAQTLGYTAAMQEAGIPVTFAYIADAHDKHDTGGACASASGAQGPGSPCYEQQLHEYNQAFQAYFERLAADGLTKSNTLFVFTADEGDHYAGGPPTNAGCNGVTTPCNYTSGTSGPNTVGEIAADLQQLVQKETGNNTAFDYHFDSAPTIYVHNDPNGPPGPTDPKVRGLERDMAGLTIANPRTGGTDKVPQHIVDQTTQDILHMTNTDPLRTPSFTLFADADYFFQIQSCSVSESPGCPRVNPAFAWNHGDDNPEIAQTWLGLVGPNVRNLGETGSTWTDHTDVMPTMLSALGLSPDYPPDGDVYTQALDPSALPTGVQSRLSTFQQLSEVLKQLNAPFGQFGHDAEVVSTTAVKATDPAVYDRWTAQLASCRDHRNAVADQIQAMLNDATFSGGTIDQSKARKLTGQASSLLSKMHDLSNDSTPPQGTTVCGT